MSSMIPQPPPSINIGSGPGGPGGPPTGPGGPPPGDSQGGAPDMAAVKQHLQAAIKELDAAAIAEGDDQDTAQIKTIAAKLHALIGAQAGMIDTAMGAGPGVKLVRKTAPPAGA